jgi:hypothetical protein
MINRVFLIALQAISFAAGADTSESGQALTATGLKSALASKASLPDRSASGNHQSAALIDVKRPEAVAAARTLADKLSDAIHAMDFGVKCDNVADDTAAINATLSAAAGKTITFPAGSCRYSGGGTLAAGTVIVGAGRNATFIRATSQANTLFTVSGYGAGIRSMAFQAAVTQTGGSYVVLSGPESFIEDFNMTGDHNGILMIGNVSRIRHGRFQDGAAGSIRIRAEGGDNSQLIDDVLMGAQSPQVAAAGIRVRNSSALIISNTSVITMGVGLLIDPYTARRSTATDAGGVFSLWVHHCFFDNSSANGIKIIPSGTAAVVRSRFDNVWASSSGSDGVLINNTGTGVVSGLHFESLHALLNTGAGISTKGAISDLSITGGEIAQNAFGISQEGSVNGFRVRGAMIGAGAGVSGNTNSAIVLAAATEGILIVENDLRGNGGTISDSATAAADKVIRGNLGYNPKANTAIAVTASPFNWTNTTGDTVVAFIQGGTVSRVTVNGKTIAAMSNIMVIVPQGASAAVTYSVPPMMSYNGM